MRKVVAFDLDGTLLESSYHLIPAYQEALARMGLPMGPSEHLMQAIGGTMEDNHRLFMSGHSFEEYLAYERLVVELAQAFLERQGRTYDGVAEMLTELHRRGYTCVLCSNGGAPYVEMALRVTGLSELVDRVRQIHEGMTKSDLLAGIIEDLDAQGHTLMVGDRRFDAQAARDNGAPFIGCLYGLFPDEVQAALPAGMLRSPSELPDLADRLSADWN